MQPADMTVFAHDTTYLDQIGILSGFNILRRPNNGHKRLYKRLEEARNIFFLVAATDLPLVTEHIQKATKQHHLRALFVRDEDPKWLPQMFNRADLRTLKKTFVHSGPELPLRVLRAWHMGAQQQLIADARLIDDRLLVVSCAAESYEIEFHALPELSDMAAPKRNQFEVAGDGSYIHWPGPDVHIDLERIRYVTDETFRRRFDVKRSQHDQRFGAAIAVFRKEQDLRQTDIPGLSSRQVRRIESGGPATPEALRKLSEAHGLDLDTYLQEVAKAATLHQH